MVSPVPVLPSPKVHLNVIGSPSGSEEPAALKVTASPDFTVPEGSTDMVAVGGLFELRRPVHPASEGARNMMINRQASPRGPVIACYGKGR